MWRHGGRLVALALVPAGLVLAACSSSTPAASPSSSNANSTSSSASVTKTASNPTYGTILVDKSGKTLYTLTSGGQAVSCTGSCATIWPPLLTSSGQPATHGGLALYTFAGDQSAGDAKGEGISSFGGVWHVVKVGGGGSTSSSAGGGSTSSTAGSGGYGY